MKNQRLDLSDDFPRKSRAFTRTELWSQKYQSHELVGQTSLPKPGRCVQKVSIQMCPGVDARWLVPMGIHLCVLWTSSWICLRLRVWFRSSGCSRQGFPPFYFLLSRWIPGSIPQSDPRPHTVSWDLSLYSGFSRARPAVLGAGCIFYPGPSLL